MTEQEFEKKYGRPPVKTDGNTRTVIYWDRIIIALVLLILLLIGVVKLIGAIVSAFKGGDDSSSKPAVAAVTKPDSSSEEDEQKEYDLTVFIDPGHGGDDGGAQNSEATRFEKNDTLNVSLKVRDELEEMGVTVMMSRETDEFVPLDDICKKANNSQADLFVSIHRNSSEEEYKGVEIWVNNHKPEADTLLASNILAALDEVGISENRKVCYGFIGEPQSNYQVNRQTHMPSCLVELGFITNDEDNRLLDEHIDEYAKAIADAVVKTGIELGITDENGERLTDEPYLSTKPQWNEKTDTYYIDGKRIYGADNPDPIFADEVEDTKENTDENTDEQATE